MYILKYVLIGTLLTVVSQVSNSQAIVRKTLVEHFTNTKCSICASRNPGFYAVLTQNPNVLHVAYHPSSPYNTCLFSMQNKSENDARTKHYGLFGGTPTFVINGVQKSSSDVQDVNVYGPFQNQTSPISVNVFLSPSSNDSIKVMVEIKAVSQHNHTTLSLYVPLVEDTVFYNAPNGENKHYDVFRKSFTGINPINFAAPIMGGNPYIYTSKIAKSPLWNLKRLSAMGIVSSISALGVVSSSDLSVVQVEQSDVYNETMSSSVNESLNDIQRFTIYPNPALNTIQINANVDISGNQYDMYNSMGKIVKSGLITHDEMGIDIDWLPTGLYVMKIGKAINFISKSFLKL